MLQLVLEDVHQLSYGDPYLTHGIPVPNCYPLVLQRPEVHCDTVEGANLVLPPVAASDTLGVIVLGGEMPPDQAVYRLAVGASLSLRLRGSTATLTGAIWRWKRSTTRTSSLLDEESGSSS